MKCGTDSELLTDPAAGAGRQRKSSAAALAQAREDLLAQLRRSPSKPVGGARLAFERVVAALAPRQRAIYERALTQPSFDDEDTDVRLRHAFGNGLQWSDAPAASGELFAAWLAGAEVRRLRGGKSPRLGRGEPKPRSIRLNDQEWQAFKERGGVPWLVSVLAGAEGSK